MKRHKRSFRELMDYSFARFRDLPPGQEESAGERVLQRLRKEPEWDSDVAGVDVITPIKVGRDWRWPRFAVVTAAVFTATAIIVAALISYNVAPANMVSGSLYRVAGEKTYTLNTGQRIEYGETLRSDGEADFTLADGSRVEMRSKSELVLEPAEDGVRIRLGEGSVIVNAAKQRTGHLYVQTKDLTASVVGTVFFVNAEEEGSRVAVFEGEVRVKQGDTERSLRPGEQVTTNPAIELRSMSQEISWSREAETLMALLQQLPQPAASNAPPLPVVEKKLAFEEVSIRPIGKVNYQTCQTQAGQVRIDPGRMTLRGVNTYWLFLVAYQEKDGLFCDYPETWKFLAENSKPDWFESFHFDVEATIPRGYVTYTGSQVAASENLQLMVRSLLEDRFKLKMHQITQEVDGFVLKPDKDKKPTLELTPWNNDIEIAPGRTGGIASYRTTQDPKTGETVYETLLWRWSMKEHIHSLVDDFEKPILDASGITGEFNLISRSSCPSLGVLFIQTGEAVRRTPCVNTLDEPGPLYKRLGLKLEDAKFSVKTWVIDHVEKPSEN